MLDVVDAGWCRVGLPLRHATIIYIRLAYRIHTKTKKLKNFKDKNQTKQDKTKINKIRQDKNKNKILSCKNKIKSKSKVL